MLIKSHARRIERRDRKHETLLRFLRDETWTSMPVAARLLNLTEPAAFRTLKQLEGRRCITRHRVDALRLSLWGITPEGLSCAWTDKEAMEQRPVFEASKVSPLMIGHKLAVQLARLQAEARGFRDWTLPGRLPDTWRKRPDATAIAPGRERIAVEVEQSIKTLKRYEAIFAAYLQLIRQGELAAVHYVCPDAAFAARLRRYFDLVRAVPVGGERVAIGDKHRAKFPVFALEQWPPSK